jgi:hypothetical protein
MVILPSRDRANLIVSIFLMIFPFAPLLHSQVDVSPTKRVAQEDDVREAIFRFQLKDQTGIIFLQIDHRDPSDSFMKRFADIKLPIKKGSAIAKPDRRSQRRIYDRSTGKTGVALWVGKFTWSSDQSAVVDGGYYCRNLCAGRGDFYVTLKGGRWVVERFDLKIIS